MKSLLKVFERFSVHIHANQDTTQVASEVRIPRRLPDRLTKKVKGLETSSKLEDDHSQ